jgi:hypothetical protein
VQLSIAFGVYDYRKKIRRVFMNADDDVLKKYFGVIARPETYLNTLYLFLAFPLGLTYFILLTVGFSLGLSLIIIWIGLLILAILFPVVWALIAFERLQVIKLLKVEVAPMSSQPERELGLWQRTKDFFTNPVTWKGLLYLFLKFPIGIAEFIIITTGLALTFGMIFAPLAYPWVTINFGFWVVDSFAEALGVTVIGILILPAIFHSFNFVAQLNGKFAKVMLGSDVHKELKRKPISSEIVSQAE